jgi:hypothetical protein
VIDDSHDLNNFSIFQLMPGLGLKMVVMVLGGVTSTQDEIVRPHSRDDLRVPKFPFWFVRNHDLSVKMKFIELKQ